VVFCYWETTLGSERDPMTQWIIKPGYKCDLAGFCNLFSRESGGELTEAVF
jgi:hypothetical protein